MTVISRRTGYVLLFSFVLLSIAMRYPLVDHERNQADSYFIHYLSQSILDSDRALWTFSPLSYFGYYPVSYPSGAPFLLAELSELTGASVELSILLSGMILSLLFVLGAFALIREFVHRIDLVFAATFFAILAPKIIDTTYWCATARGPFIVLMVLVVWAMFRASRTRNRLLTYAAILMGAGCFALHHMAVVFLLFGLAYVLAVVLSARISRQFPAHRTRYSAVFVSVVAVAIGIASFLVYSLPGRLVRATFEEAGYFDFSPQIASTITNILVSYTGQIGVILPIALLGAIGVIQKSAVVGTRSFFLLTALIAFIPLLGNSVYVSMILAPFVSILAMSWFSRGFRNGRLSRLKSCAVVVLVLSSVALPLGQMQRWNSLEYLSSDRVEVENQVFNDALYVEWNENGQYIMSNALVMRLEVGAMTGADFLGSGFFAALNGDIDAADLKGQFRLSESEFPENLYSWFYYSDDIYIDYFIIGVMILGADYTYSLTALDGDSYDYMLTHSRLTVLIDNRWSSEFVNQYGQYAARFPDQLRNAEGIVYSYGTSVAVSLSSYAYYESERVTLYLVELPHGRVS
jgi:hypothetical protein